MLFKLCDKLLHAFTAWPQIAVNVFMRQITDFFFTVRLSELETATLHNLSKLYLSK